MNTAVIAAHVVTWTPYAVIVFIITFHGTVESRIISFAMFFAKLSTIYNPEILFLSSKSFRRKVVAICKRKMSTTDGLDDEEEDKIVLHVTDNSNQNISSSTKDTEDNKVMDV